MQRASRRPPAATVRPLRFRLTIAILAALSAWPPAPAPAQSESSLRDRIERGRERERELSGAVARLGALVARAGREVEIVQGRLNDVDADLVAAESRLADTGADLRSERIRLSRLRRRLAAGRATLAAQLVATYKSDPPDIVSLVLGSRSFADLLERVEFAKRISKRNSEVVERVRVARADTQREAAVLARLEVRRRQDAQAVARRRDALASMRDGLAQRQATIVRARGARAGALAGTRSGRRAAQRSLSRLLAERERTAAAASAGPGGPWAIPWPIVQCESGGQNLPPNGAGASGYYQLLGSTWRGLGGSTPHAYQATKAEQDRLAAQLWAGGAGARNWVCAGLL
ncbi:MAG TPA: transglycosylase family protein [Solirubrobacteraceae bacterium]|nr:transglycosylase family protein [Solirubrobacteraceae bacterium]